MLVDAGLPKLQELLCLSNRATKMPNNHMRLDHKKRRSFLTPLFMASDVWR